MVPILQHQLQQAEYARNIFCVIPEHGTKFEDVTKPEFWKHVSVKLQPRSRIEVIAQDSTWFAELMVIACGTGWAKVSVLRFVELAESSVKDDSKKEKEPVLKVQWKGSNMKHCVMRTSDSLVVKEGLATKADAERWIKENETDLV